MEEKDIPNNSSESSTVNIRLVIIVAILLCFVGLLSASFLGNPIIALFGFAVVIPLATVFALLKNRTRILDSGMESAPKRPLNEND